MRLVPPTTDLSKLESAQISHVEDSGYTKEREHFDGPLVGTGVS